LKALLNNGSKETTQQKIVVLHAEYRLSKLLDSESVAGPIQEL
jgi:hypothetical protein